MRAEGLGHVAAHDWLVQRWPWVATWNADFEDFLDRRWLTSSG
jgi:hypothetical protein